MTALEISDIDSKRAIRIWPIVVFASTGMSCMLVPTLLGMDDSIRFSILAMGAFAHLIIVGLWLLLGSNAPWRDRVWLLLLSIAGLALTMVTQHKSLGISVLLFGTPIAASTLAISLLVTRNVAWIQRRWLCFAAWIVPLLIWLPTRSEGFAASFAPELRWRWSADVEQRTRIANSRSETKQSSLRVVTKVELQDGDWPRFRGLNSDGIADDRGLQLSEKTVAKLVWKRAIGPAWSSVIVVDGLLYTQEQRDSQEAVVCLEATTGVEIWSYSYEARFDDQTKVSGTGPRSTPTFANGKIYSVGGTGIVTCLSSVDGKLVWQRELSNDCKTPVAMWGFSSSPTIQSDRCFLVGGGNKDGAQDAICYDASTGDIRWSSSGRGETYSSPKIADLCGEQQLIVSVGRSIVGRNIVDGAERWRVKLKGMGNTMLLPIQLAKNKLLLASGEGDGTGLYEIQHVGEEWRAVEKWSSSRLRPDFNDVVVLDDFILGLTKGLLTCVDSKDGQMLWKKFRFESGQLIALPNQHCVLVLSEQGELNLIRIEANEPKLLLNWAAIQGKTWNHPVLVGNQVFCRNAEEIACYSLE